MGRILIVDNDDGLLHFLSRLLARQGHEVAACGDAQAALQTLAADRFDAIFLDYKMPGRDGLDSLVEIKRAHIKTPVIMMTAHGTTETAIEAMKRGAFDYLLKPFDTEELRRVAADAIEVSRLMQEVVSVADATARIGPPGASHAQIIGSHRKMQAVFKLIGQVAEKDVTVLISGESGTGKELVARAVYHHSRRQDAPFMAVNCAAIPETLFESELFGYEQGAFTGADRTYLGKFERCHKRTLFLDEIGDMSLGTQAKVLRVLQEGEFDRLGGGKTVKVDVRLLAATNRDLAKEVAAGRFREDLYYRLKIISIHLPPLRERREDVPALVNYFLARFAAEYVSPLQYVAEPAMAKLGAYAWPGNVRELENCLRRAVLVSQGDVLLPEHVRLEGQPETAGGAEAATPETAVAQKIAALLPEILAVAGKRPHANLIDLVEKALIAQALDACKQNQVRTARMLGISRNTLRHRMKKFGLDLPGE